MRKLLAPALMVLVCLVTLGSPVGAQGSKTYFDGTTGQGEELFFIVEDIGGVATFEPFFTNFTIKCNGQTFQFAAYFIGFEIPLDQHGRFDINIPSDQLPFDWRGTVVGLKARGTQSQGYAAYDRQGGVVDCGTGSVDWQAAGVGTETPRGGHTRWTMTVTKDENGRITETITQG
jgi:hypothetical protein